VPGTGERNDSLVSRDGTWGRISVAFGGSDPAGSESPSYDFAMLNETDGSLSTWFNGDGTLRLDRGRRGVFQGGDGKFLVAQLVGTTREQADAHNHQDVRLTRYNANGTRDLTFGGDGVLAQTTIAAADEIDDIEILPDGRIALATRASLVVTGVGTSTHVAQVIVLSPDGQLLWQSEAFRRSEQVFSQPNAVHGLDLEAAPNGGVLLLGDQRDLNLDIYIPFISRFTARGQKDLEISLTTPADADGKRVQVDDRGRMWVLGWDMRSGDDFAPQMHAFVSRYLPDGTLDAGYGEGGTVLLADALPNIAFNPGTSDGEINTLAHHALAMTLEDDRVVIAGLAIPEVEDPSDPGANAQLRLVALLGGGDAVTTPLSPGGFAFGDDGTLEVAGHDGADDIELYLRQSDGRLIVRTNGVARSLAPSRVKRIFIRTGGGEDFINIGDGIKQVYVDGGEGDDAFVGRGGNAGDILVNVEQTL